ncbi:DUF2127 domain-containing protein [Tumidithrix elongata RA019]|uniref:DUF2127 domain-containing protein n=1 Tax=Tumidithrix elongata BACA0141 TaxID=2716417 RepID=A0AAW9PPH0_9CYAN|nr:DUF2127 domain-containing protein [Tumidithrix elongata RA019]
MEKIGKRPTALIAIVAYKAFTATLLAVTSIAIFSAYKNYDGLLDFAESMTLSGKRGMIVWGLEKVVNLSPKTLEFSAIGAAIYAIVTAIEAVGLWYEQSWARWLVLIVVGISIPIEIFELIKGIAIVKLIVFILNVGIFWYLLREFPKLHHKSSS